MHFIWIGPGYQIKMDIIYCLSVILKIEIRSNEIFDESKTFLTTSTGVCVGTWNKRTFLFRMIAHTYNQEELMEM